MLPIDKVIRTELIPALTGHKVPDNSPLRNLLSLPARFGGLALPVISAAAVAEHQTSLEVTMPLVRLSVSVPVVTHEGNELDGGLPATGQGDGGRMSLVAVRLVLAVIGMMVPAVNLMLMMLVVVLVKWTLWWQQLARSVPMRASDVEARLHHSGHELRTCGHNSLPHSSYWWRAR